MSHQFYLTLPSNSSMDIYPDNKTSNFIVNLPNALELNNRNWEVGFSEIQFPHLWYNISKGRNTIKRVVTNPTTEELNYFFPIEEGKDVAKETEKRKQLLSRKPDDMTIEYKIDINIPEGYYSSIEQLISILQRQESGNPNPIHYSYNPISRRSIIQTSNQTKLYFQNSDIARCLGFKSDHVTGNTVSEFTSTVKKYNSIYVYTDIIQNQNVGDYKVPLLRVVPVISLYGENSCVRYDRPHFIPISRHNIQTIEVNLRDDTGELISFESGKAIVTLVFRRRSARFYE